MSDSISIHTIPDHELDPSHPAFMLIFNAGNGEQDNDSYFWQIHKSKNDYYYKLTNITKNVIIKNIPCKFEDKSKCIDYFLKNCPDYSISSQQDQELDRF